MTKTSINQQVTASNGQNTGDQNFAPEVCRADVSRLMNSLSNEDSQLAHDLITVFNDLDHEHRTMLVHSAGYYLAAQNMTPSEEVDQIRRVAVRSDDPESRESLLKWADDIELGIAAV